MKYQDIQIADNETRAQFMEYMRQGRYQEALGLLSPELGPKIMSAKNLNDLTDKIVEVENLSDTNFKKNKIKVSATPPEGLQTGQIYFKLI